VKRLRSASPTGSIHASIILIEELGSFGPVGIDSPHEFLVAPGGVLIGRVDCLHASPKNFRSVGDFLGGETYRTTVLVPSGGSKLGNQALLIVKRLDASFHHRLVANSYQVEGWFV